MTEKTLPPRRQLFVPKTDKPEVSTRGDVKGTLVGVRMQPELLDRLDKSRGNKTRPEKVRELVDKGLAKAK